MRKDVLTPSATCVATITRLDTFRNIAFCDVFTVGEAKISALMTLRRDASHLTR